MAMSKKDFIALADEIKAYNRVELQFRHLGRPYTESQINSLADVCAASNRKFNRQRWLDYIAGRCGANGGKVGK